MINWDDFQKSVNEQFNKQVSNVGDYLAKQILNAPPLVKIGPNPGGNLSEVQLKEGQRPVIEQVKPNNSFMGSFDWKPWAIGAAVVAGAFFVIKKLK